MDCTSSFAIKVLRKLGILPGIDVGNRKKSWDVLQTVDFIGSRLPKDAPVMDIGAYQCEVLPALHRLGYTKLAGIDLNPRIVEMPHADVVRYLCCDLLDLPAEDGTFTAVTAISVIEHGFDGPRLLGEISRVLNPGGYFLASVDYWPDKIDTSAVREYRMDWRIFSEEELRAFLHQAAGYGLLPVGGADFGARDRVVAWNGRNYTFAWIALRKDF
jgi:SAM-dependent methyltransferase